MSDTKSALLQYNAAMDALDAAEKAVQDALLHIKTSASASTVEVEGQFFQVRERKDKLYLCELNGKPRGRPKGSKNSKPRKGSKAVEAGDDGEPVVPRDIASIEGVVEFLDTVTANADYEPVPEVTGVHAVSEVIDSVDGVESVEGLDAASA